MAGLKKQLGWMDVFTVAAGAMISSGLFVLPALAFAAVGPGVVLSYLLASVLILPSVLSKAELATAMPRAGGTYFFVERSLGPVWGLFSGLAGWFSLALKSAFAVVGMVYLLEAILAFVDVRLSTVQVKAVATAACVLFTVLNVISVKHTVRLQLFLVMGLLLLLIGFAVVGASSVEATRFTGFLRAGWLDLLAAAGLVFVSFGGLTKVASIAEEVRRPGRNIPLGVLLAWLSVSVLYVAVVMVVVGVMPGERLASSHLPVSDAAATFWGTTGFVVMALAALAAFVTTANGGLLAASRSPLAMARDQLLPSCLAAVSPRFGTPVQSVIVTGAFMTVAVLAMGLELLVKTASTMMILLFILDNLSVIVMRESRIQAYRPGFRSPLYPTLQIVAVVAYVALIVDMGKGPLAITGGFLLASLVWYIAYARGHVQRASAVMHVVERVTDKTLKTVTLENELRDILLERDQIVEDRFDGLIRQCVVLDLEGPQPAEVVFRKISELLAERMGASADALYEKFLEREAEASTVIQPGMAIPHVVVDGHRIFDVVLVRAREGIVFPGADEPVRIMFVLAGSRDERNYHLRALMAIAQIAQQKHFESQWLEARDEEGLRNLVLLSKRTRG